jgi:hypothetical protein
VSTYTFRSRVMAVKEHFESMNWRLEDQGDGRKVPTCDQRSLGWYVTLEGSYESWCVGSEKPDFVQGQAVKISIVPIG